MMMVNSYQFDISKLMAEILADSPFLYYRLGEASGAVAADSSGNSRNGIIAGTSGTAISLGVAGLADDADTAVKYLTNAGYVRSSSNFAFPGNNITLMCIIKPDASAPAGYIMGLSANADPSVVSTSRDRCLSIDTAGKLRGYIYSGAQSYVVSPANVNDNTAKIVHLASGAGSTELYINGVQVATVAAVSNQSYTAYLYGGMGNLSDTTGGSANGLRGVQDEMAWFNTKLSAARILAHAQACGLA